MVVFAIGCININGIAIDYIYDSESFGVVFFEVV
jgi:hypothetical protein